MNRSSTQYTRHAGTFAVMVVTPFLLLACATAPSSPPGAAETRHKLTALQNDKNLAQRAELELREAETAVLLAEQPLPATEASLGAHRVFMADRKVEIARAEATTAYTEDQRKRFAEERDAARLAARTREADQARDDADHARADASRAQGDSYRAQGDANRARDDAALAHDSADRAREDASQARSATDAAKAEAATESAHHSAQMQQQIDDANRASKAADAAKEVAATDAARQAAELQRQIDVLEAETTDRGLVLTLGDVLFTTGSAELQDGASNRLNKLVGFLNQYPERDVLIEGHTDNVGNADYNQGLSQRRAESVQSYLAQQGIGQQRMSASGMGLNRPIAGNDSAAGRQQNRRVEIIIENPPLVSTSSSLN